MNKEVRVRFAPSPTGPLHIGGVRTALYNFLFAKQHNGKMILRIEDTDQARYVEKAEEYISQSLAWCGITTDESPQISGPYGPYRQSERKEMYQQYIQQLLDDDKAYLAFDSAEELEQMRETLKAKGVDNPTYNAISRTTMSNSLTLPFEEVQDRIKNGDPYVVRIKIPLKEEIRLNDMIRGWVMVQSSMLDDKVLVKSDGMPTYHLANVVDDYLMKITHVIRGEEWLPSAPLHVLLYQFLGWADHMPQFAHLPLILKSDGNGKLSKRDGLKHGFPVFPMEWREEKEQVTAKGFKEEGYLPEAFINFLAFLGWNPGTEREVFNMDELIEAFSIDRISKGGAKFDIQKARWFNQQYLKAKPDEELAAILMQQLKANGINYEMKKAVQVVGQLKERVELASEFLEKGSYFFQSPASYDDKVVAKKWTGEAVEVFEAYTLGLEGMDQVSSEDAKSILEKVLEEKNVKIGRIMQALRVSLTGQAGGPDLMEIIHILGAQETARRIKQAIETLEVTA